VITQYNKICQKIYTTTYDFIEEVGNARIRGMSQTQMTCLDTANKRERGHSTLWTAQLSLVCSDCEVTQDKNIR